MDKKFVKGLIVVIIAFLTLFYLISQHNTIKGEETLNPLNKAGFDINEIVLDYFIDRLATCESSQIPDVIHENDGAPGSHSYAWLQFKISTFEEKGRLYNLPHNDIWNPSQQIEIAKAMIRNDKNAWKHWRTCSQKIGLDKWKPIPPLVQK